MSVLEHDHGNKPFILDIEKATLDNENFRDTLWTGQFLQMTVMSIPVGSDIGAEVHDDHDQFLRVEQGKALVTIGDDKDHLDINEIVEDDWAIFVPAGKYHNVINKGDQPLKVYSIYAQPDHVKGTIHRTQKEALEDPNEQHD